MIVFRPATVEDAVWLSSRLRLEDVRECMTVTGRSPEEILPASVVVSQECYTIRRVEGDKVLPEPVALCGVSTNPVAPEEGLVWLLASDDVRLCALSLIREAPLWLDHMSRHYPKGLSNYADRRNSLHIRWCLLTGFSLGKTIHLNGAEFYPIHRPCALIQ